MKILVLIFSLIFSTPVMAQTVNAFQGACALPGEKISTQGLMSTTYAFTTYPRCSVTVYLTGTTNKATIYSTKTHTTLLNPFIANTDASWLFYAADGQGYDVTTRGGSPYPMPVVKTLVDLIHGGSGGNGCTTTGNSLLIGNGSGGCSNSPADYASTLAGSFTFAPAANFNVTAVDVNLNTSAPADLLGNGSQICTFAVGCGTVLQTQIIPPVAGQYVIIYPTEVVAGITHGTTGSAAGTGSSGPGSFADFGVGPHNVINGFGGEFEFTGYGPSFAATGIPAGNVTAVYVQSGFGYFGPIDPESIGCSYTGGSAVLSNAGPNLIGSQLTGLTGANISSVDCAGAPEASVDTTVPAGLYTTPMALIVYYTGSPIAGPDTIQVSSPLTIVGGVLGINSQAPFPGLYQLPYTVATLPSSSTWPVLPVLNAIYNVSDGTGASDCTTGGGSTAVQCQYNGSAYVAVGYGSGGSPGVSSINTATGAFTFSFSSGAGSCSGTTCTFTGSSSGGGTVTNFIASSGWPTWLTPTVTLSTTTPTLTVSASAIPNSALATQTANTVMGALTATTPSGLAMPSCSASADALQWTTSSGFGCNTAVGNTISTSLTNNVFPKANGPNSLINSDLSDNGSSLTYSGSSSYSSFQLGTNSFASLPTCNGGTEGSDAPVTDSTTNTWGATITGSGSDHVKAYCDGTNWTVMAK